MAVRFRAENVVGEDHAGFDFRKQHEAARSDSDREIGVEVMRLGLERRVKGTLSPIGSSGSRLAPSSSMISDSTSALGSSGGSSSPMPPRGLDRPRRWARPRMAPRLGPLISEA
jgi:hypothetical protein